MMTPAQLMHKGGKWLAAARTWIQWNKNNGDSVTWGSQDVLQPPMTARDAQEIAAAASVAAILEVCEQNARLVESLCRHKKNEACTLCLVAKTIREPLNT